MLLNSGAQPFSPNQKPQEKRTTNSKERITASLIGWQWLFSDLRSGSNFGEHQRQSTRKNIKRTSGDNMSEQSVPQLLKDLWGQGVFSTEKNYQAVKNQLSKLGCNPTDAALGMALSRAKFLTQRGTRGDYRYIQKHAPKRIILTANVLPDELIAALGRDFETEIEDLRLNYGQSGTCTAFLLRKILEKLIFLTFAKNGLDDKLEDKAKSGGLVGLQTMVNLAIAHKINGKPFLMSKTAKSIEGIKFLGDTSAHNPIVNVSMKTIEQVMPFIVTAYSELAKKL